MNAVTRDLHPFPRHIGVMIGLVLSAIMLLVAAVRLTGANIHYADAPAVSTLALRFEDRPDGSVAVIDAARGRVLDTVVGEAGFLRGTMRGLARERKRLGIGAGPEFHLIGRADGRLTLLDPATAQRIDLESFGPRTHPSSCASWISAAAP